MSPSIATIQNFEHCYVCVAIDSSNKKEGEKRNAHIKHWNEFITHQKPPQIWFIFVFASKRLPLVSLIWNVSTLIWLLLCISIHYHLVWCEHANVSLPLMRSLSLFLSSIFSVASNNSLWLKVNRHIWNIYMSAAISTLNFHSHTHTHIWILIRYTELGTEQMQIIIITNRFNIHHTLFVFISTILFVFGWAQICTNRQHLRYIGIMVANLSPHHQRTRHKTYTPSRFQADTNSLVAGWLVIECIAPE